MQTLKSICQHLHTQYPSYRMPALSPAQAAEEADWYVISMPDCLWVLRAADVPRGDFAYRDVEDRVVARLRRVKA